MIALQRFEVLGSELALVWNDGLESYISLERLRRACPCAACQGEPDALGRVVVPVSNIGPRGFDLVSLHPVGGYAIQIAWGDGHASGIYTLDLLRRLGAEAG
jgi:DUF971 family protein